MFSQSRHWVSALILGSQVLPLLLPLGEGYDKESDFKMGGHTELLSPYVCQSKSPWSMCLFVLRGTSTGGRIQSHSSQPASLTQKGIMFIASGTAGHIESNILLEAEGTSVGPILFHCRSVAGASAGAGSHLRAAWARWLCLFTLHDSTARWCIPWNPEKRRSPNQIYHRVSVPRCFEYKDREILSRGSTLWKAFVWVLLNGNAIFTDNTVWGYSIKKKHATMNSSCI